MKYVIHISLMRLIHCHSKGFESTGSLVTQRWPSAERIAYVSETQCRYSAHSLDGLAEGSSMLPIMKRVAESRLQFKVARPPGLVEPRLQRTIQSQDREPTLAGNRGNPVGFLSRWRFGSKPDGRTPVGIGNNITALAADTRERRTRSLQQ